MKLLVGLGNPGKKYENTRHNVGFLLIDFLISHYELRIEDTIQNFHSSILEVSIADTKVLLVKPQTFMNESGTAVQEICNFYKVDVSKDLLVLHDEIDLPFGTIRNTESSSAAGHNGVKDIIEKLGTQNFHRLRIGVESRASRQELPTEAFVLQNFSDSEIKTLKTEVFEKIKPSIDSFLK